MDDCSLSQLSCNLAHNCCGEAKSLSGQPVLPCPQGTSTFISSEGSHSSPLGWPWMQQDWAVVLSPAGKGQRKLLQNLFVSQLPRFMRASELALRKIVFLYAFFCFSVISNCIISTFLYLGISKFMTRASQNTSWMQENTTTVTCLIVTRL